MPADPTPGPTHPPPPPSSAAPDRAPASDPQPPSRWVRWLYRYTGGRPCRLIVGPGGQAYLERYHLFRLPGGGGCYLHRFVASDPDRGLHDHPWGWAASLILAGRYWEELAAGGAWRCPGRIRWLRGEDFHRVVLPADGAAGGVWSLFCHGPKRKDWGFLKNEQFVPHQQQLGEAGHGDWWHHAPLGRDAARQPLQPARGEGSGVRPGRPSRPASR